MKNALPEIAKFTDMEADLLKIRDIKPQLLSYISEALALIKRAPVPDDEAVHDIRVLMKKCRASLKLLSPMISTELFKKEYLVFRDTGRAFCSSRESAVHRKTLRNLKKENGELFEKLADNEKINQLLGWEEKKLVGEDTGKSEDPATKILGSAGFRLRFLSVGKPDPLLLLMQLESSFSAVCSEFVSCRNCPRTQKLHTLRKKLKDLLYQLFFFRPVNPVTVKSIEKQIESLTRNLGAYNDLAQLLLAIGYDPNDQTRPHEMDELMILIRNRQDYHLSKVWPAAYKIFRPGHTLSDLIGFRHDTVISDLA
jgi:CHAD domain-containing protein